jgi:hypothetical protein
MESLVLSKNGSILGIGIPSYRPGDESTFNSGAELVYR